MYCTKWAHPVELRARTRCRFLSLRRTKRRFWYVLTVNCITWKNTFSSVKPSDNLELASRAVYQKEVFQIRNSFHTFTYKPAYREQQRASIIVWLAKTRNHKNNKSSPQSFLNICRACRSARWGLSNKFTELKLAQFESKVPHTSHAYQTSVSLENTQDRPGSAMRIESKRPKFIRKCTYQHKTIASTVRLLLGKLWDDGFQVLSGKENTFIKIIITFHTK